MMHEIDKMELIILNDGLYQLVQVSTQMMEGITLLDRVLVSCSDLCDILRLKLTTYAGDPLNAHFMKDGSGDFYGCICR